MCVPEEQFYADPEYRCLSCPLLLLDQAITGDRVRQLQTGFDVCAAMQAGLKVDWKDLLADEFLAVTLIHAEQLRLRSEQMRPDGEQ